MVPVTMIEILEIGTTSPEDTAMPGAIEVGRKRAAVGITIRRKASTSRSVSTAACILLMSRTDSPPVPAKALPRHLNSSVSPRVNNGGLPTHRAGFQPVSIPTGPRSRAPQSRPAQSSKNFFDSSSAPPTNTTPEVVEPVILLEEEKDPEQALEERRRKREEIMAKFKANGRTAAVTPGPGESQKLGTGADSVTSGGLKTVEKAGLLTGTTTGQSCRIFSDLQLITQVQHHC